MNLGLMEKGWSRRDFLGGVIGTVGAFGTLDAWAATDPQRKANLTLGVLSDIHVRHAGENGTYGGTGMFRKALEWFRDQGVDAVMITGDLADQGLVEQLEDVAAVWYEVFPGDSLPGGGHVEKLFICGNHDFLGACGNPWVERTYPDLEERKRHVLRNDMGGWWKRIFHEDYARFYRKTVKGYVFLGRHWDDGTRDGPASDDFGREISDFLSAHGKALDPRRPFFYFQHPPLKDTCYGPWAWGRDAGKTTSALANHPNAIAVSGHSHYSLTDERSIWQGSFTSIGAASLRYTGLPGDELHPGGYENSAAFWGVGKDYDTRKLMPPLDDGDSHQGMLWRVYDDRIVICRREFGSGLSLGADWVVPLPVARERPFAFSTRAKRVGVPEFPKGSKLEIRPCRVSNRGGEWKGKRTDSVVRDAYRITIPAAIANANARCFSFRVRVAGEKGRLDKHVLAEGFNHGRAHPKAKSSSSCVFSVEELRQAGRNVTVEVHPRNSFAVSGAPLRARLSV